MKNSGPKDIPEGFPEVLRDHGRLTIFGGKNPHPNYLVGGEPCSINLDESNAINAERLACVGKLLEDAWEFIEKVYIPDLLAVASFYKGWGAIGGAWRTTLHTATCRRTDMMILPASSFPEG
jgi:hydrogenase large subunit